MGDILITESQLKRLILKEEVFNLNVDIPDSIDVDTCSDFLSFISHELELTTPYTVNLKNERGDIKTLANYNLQNGDIKIYIKDRGLADILRSIAHEVVHHQQNQNGKLNNGPIQDIGGDIEDEANAVAGQLVKKYGYDHQHIFG
jgi:hypothetical protein